MFVGAVVEYLSYSDSGLGLSALGQPFFVPCFLGGLLAIASGVLARTMLDKPAGALAGPLGAPAFVEPADHRKPQRWVLIHVAVIPLLIVLGFLPRLLWELRFLAQPNSQTVVVSLQRLLLTGNLDSLEARAALFVLRLLAVDSIYALASICLALGLLRYKSWARTVSMVFAAVWLALEGPDLLRRTVPWSSVWVVFASAYALGILLLPGVAKAFSRRVR
jgi:hypothetical protein